MKRLLLLILPIYLVHADSEHRTPEASNYDFNTVVPKFSLQPPFVNIYNNWNSTGSVLVARDAVRITPHTHSMEGAIWNLNHLEAPFFRVDARFRIYARDPVYADGFAIWFTEEPGSGSAYGNNPNFTGIGIVLDTFQNAYGFPKTPFMALVASDGTKLLDNDNDGKDLRLDQCELPDDVVNVQKSRTTSAKPSETLAIRFEYHEDCLTGWYYEPRVNEFTKCFNHCRILLPSYFHLGVTARTGDLVAEHSLVSFEVRTGSHDAVLPRQFSFDGTNKGQRVLDEAYVEYSVHRFSLWIFMLAVLAVVAYCLFSVWSFLRDEGLLGRRRRNTFY